MPSMKTSMIPTRGKALLRTLLMLSGFALALTGCVYEPAPYGYGGGPGGYAPNYGYAPQAPEYAPGYGYAPPPGYYPPGYAYAPGYYYGPSIIIGGGRGHGDRR